MRNVCCADDNFDFMSDLELSTIEDNVVSYAPFSSKAQALLFFLIHSPRPMVLDCVVAVVVNMDCNFFYIFLSLLIYYGKGERNLKFIFHICKQLDPSLPGLEAVKVLAQSLPEFVPPTKVLGTDS